MMSKKSKSKLRVAVLMGGPSSEYEVSLATARNVISALSRRKYQVKKILINKKGEWIINHYKKEPRAALKNISVVFNALHGEYGEDGVVQSVLEKLKIKFTGSRQLSSALAMDKIASRKILKIAGLDVPRDHVFYREHYLGSRWAKSQIKRNFSPPVVVKPSQRGSSVGVAIVRDFNDLGAALDQAFKHDSAVLVEEYLRGQELTCGVLESKNNKLIALPPTAIKPQKTPFFDYQAKYKPGWTKEVTPAPLDEGDLKKVQHSAVLAHQTLGCSHYSRTDMILARGRVYVLELNTLPGMTKTSLLPQAAKVYGLEFPELLDYLIGLAVEA